MPFRLLSRADAVGLRASAPAPLTVRFFRYLQEKYGWGEELCAVAAFLIMTDIGNHLQPDAVYNCEQIGARSRISFSTFPASTISRFLHRSLLQASARSFPLALPASSPQTSPKL
jgi:hypothetical protein